MSYEIPERVPASLRKCLQNMFNSSQSEAITIAELVCDCLGDCDDDPNSYVTSIAEEFSAWAKALKQSVSTEPNSNTHIDYPIEDWRMAVTNDETRLGYSEWVEHQIEMNEGE